jgi:hypothetical protein
LSQTRIERGGEIVNVMDMVSSEMLRVLGPGVSRADSGLWVTGARTTVCACPLSMSPHETQVRTIVFAVAAQQAAARHRVQDFLSPAPWLCGRPGIKELACYAITRASPELSEPHRAPVKLRDGIVKPVATDKGDRVVVAVRVIKRGYRGAAVLSASGTPQTRGAALIAEIETERTLCARCAVMALGWGLVRWTPALDSDWNEVLLERPTTHHKQDRRLVAAGAEGLDTMMSEFLRRPDPRSLRETVDALTLTE